MYFLHLEVSFVSRSIEKLRQSRMTLIFSKEHFSSQDKYKIKVFFHDNIMSNVANKVNLFATREKLEKLQKENKKFLGNLTNL